MSNDFRPLNSNEQKAIVYAVSKGRIKNTHPLYADMDSATVSYENMQGGFCICIVIVIHISINSDFPKGTPESGIKTNKYVFRGASRRSYKDSRNPIRGEMLAFSRALLYSRPVNLSLGKIDE